MKLYELCSTNELLLISGKTQSYTQLESKRVVGRPELQSSIICGSTNMKLKEEVYSFLQDLRDINLFKKMASDSEETKILMRDSETNKNKNIFVISFKMESVSSWIFWSERKLIITTYEAVLRN